MTGTAARFQRPPAPRSVLITATGNGVLDINPLIAEGYTRITGLLQSGGSGGGSGRRGADGTIRCGGGPGAPGSCTEFDLPLAALLALVPSGLIPYNVGPGTAGGAAVLVDDTNGNPGTAPTSAVNATWLGAAPGLPGCIAVGFVQGAGAGGTATSGAAGSVGNGGTFPLPAGSSASVTGAVPVQAARPWPGPGGGITNVNVASNGGAGTSGPSGGMQGLGGVVDTTLPTQGTQNPGIQIGPGPGPGGGAASRTTAAQAGASALPNSGQGGGGGGASLNGFASGAGGAGGSGYISYTVR